MKALDDTDRKIIRALQENARLSNKELAARVHLAPSSCLERARRLKEDGVLAAFQTRIDPSAVGIGLQAMISVKLRGHDAGNREAFRERVLGREEVVALYHVTGARDFILHVAVRDAEHLRRLIVDGISADVDLDALETSLVLEESTRPLPILSASGDPADGQYDEALEPARTLAFQARSRAGQIR